MKKILVLAESLRINETSSGIVSSTLIQKIRSLGFSVTVIYPKSFEYEVTWLDEFRLLPFEIKKPAKGFLQKVPKLRALPVYLNRGFSAQFQLLVNSWKEQIVIECEKNQYDFILVLGSGSEFSPHFAIGEFDIKIPFYVNIHDPFPLHNYPNPYKKKKTLLSWFLEVRFRKVLKKSKGVIFPSEKLKDHMATIFPEISGKSYVIPHVSQNLDSLPSNEFDHEVNLDTNYLNIIHAGSLLGPRNPIHLLNAIYQLERTEPELVKNVKFIFIGKLAREHKALTSQSGLVDIIDKRVSYKKSLELIEKSNGVLVIEAISDFSPFMPGKLADIFLKAKPIIPVCPKNSEVMRILGDTRYHAELDNENEIMKSLKNFITDVKAESVENKSVDCLPYTSIEVGVTLKKIFHS